MGTYDCSKEAISDYPQTAMNWLNLHDMKCRHMIPQEDPHFEVKIHIAMVERLEMR